MNIVNPLVEKQYTEWVYPEPISDLSTWVKHSAIACDPVRHHALIWPDRSYNPDLSILAAGCGTSQAAILAYTHPKARVVGVDISPSSIACTAQLKIKHNLDNLELYQMDLHKIAGLKRKFDLIYSTGVLHHLPDPQKGLEAITDVLEDRGTMILMLYAKYARLGVYMIQEALQRLGLEQTPADVMLTRHVISSLPPAHVAQPYIRGAALDIVHDAGMVDTFLHRQDRAFSVPDILAMTASCNLRFQGWLDNLDYYPDGNVPSDHPIYQKLVSLPDEEQWAVVELLVQLLGCHSFFLRKKCVAEHTFRIDFNSRSFLQTVPAYRHGLNVTAAANMTAISRSWHNLSLEGWERDVFSSIDARRTCGEIIAAQTSGQNGHEEKVRCFFARLWRLGHLTFRHQEGHGSSP